MLACGTAAATIAACALVARVPLGGYSPHAADLPGPGRDAHAAGHGLVNRLPRVPPAPTVGLFLLGEPVAASLLAFRPRRAPGASPRAAPILAALAVLTREGRR
jgi:hypothetical protein